MAQGTLSLFAGVAVLGLVHGAEPGHGWPVAATYALDRSRRWLAGLTAALVIGVGHLVSSIAVVVAFFLVASAFDVTQFGWIRYVAGVALILLGIREYRHGHSHGDAHDHGHGDVPSEPSVVMDTGDTPSGTSVLGTIDDGHAHDHGHEHDHALSADDPRGLVGLASTAFVLGFAHEEEFEILGFCTGATRHCLDLMLVYALAVVFALVVLTLLMVAGYQRYEERLEQYAGHFPTVSAAVLILMGLGFVTGVL